MLENRPIVTIAIGYIIGIIMGLYCKISIVFLYLFFYIIYLICKKRKIKRKFKIISFRRYFRYIKIVMTKKVILIIIVSSIISNAVTIFENLKYENLYKNVAEVKCIAEVISEKNEKKYKNVYKIKVNTINGEKKYKNTNLYIETSKDIEVKNGDEISIIGEFKKPQTQRNYGGFDYKEYLKTLKIYGTIDAKNVQILESSKTNNISLKIKQILKENFEENISSVLIAITLGDTSYIEENVKENFSESNIYHILAISGLHIGILSLSIEIVFKKILGKRKTRIMISILLLIYMRITDFSPSIVRAVIMRELILLATFTYRKSDIYQNISLSLLILLIYNPFLIKNTGLILSFLRYFRNYT